MLACGTRGLNRFQEPWSIMSKLWLFGFVWLVVAPAHAGYVDTAYAYRTSDYETARRGFEVMARRGHRESQYVLAVMLLNGQGGPIQPDQAYGWMSAAAAAGDDRAKASLATMRMLADSKDLARASEYEATYGLVASEKRIDRAMNADTMPMTWQRVPAIHYPPAARRELTEGWVAVEVTVNARGEAYDPRTAFALHAGTFERSVIAGIQNGRASLESPLPVAEVLRIATIQFGLTGMSPTYAVNSTLLQDICARAERGDAASQGTCATMLMFEKRTSEQDYEKGSAMMVKAAMSGQADAALAVGAALMNTGEESAMAEALDWWGVAAEAGHPAARARLLDVWLREATVDEVTLTRSKEWLDIIAQSGDEWAMKHAAAILAAHPDERIRDAKRALELLSRIDIRASIDPQVLEIEAAARAGVKDFAGAAQAQERAIDQARSKQWDTKEMEKRREHYRRRGVWLGDLIRRGTMVPR